MIFSEISLPITVLWERSSDSDLPVIVASLPIPIFRQSSSDNRFFRQQPFEPAQSNFNYHTSIYPCESQHTYTHINHLFTFIQFYLYFNYTSYFICNFLHTFVLILHLFFLYVTFWYLSVSIFWNSFHKPLLESAAFDRYPRLLLHASSVDKSSFRQLLRIAKFP